MKAYNSIHNRIIDANTAIILWWYFKDIMLNKNIDQWELALSVWVEQPTISKTLNWVNKKPELYSYYKIWSALWFSEEEFIKLFEKADTERLWISLQKQSLPYSLDSKLRNLSPEQQKMVDRFVTSIQDE